jgi:hypothetical protein
MGTAIVPCCSQSLLPTTPHPLQKTLCRRLRPSFLWLACLTAGVREEEGGALFFPKMFFTEAEIAQDDEERRKKRQQARDDKRTS